MYYITFLPQSKAFFTRKEVIILIVSRLPVILAEKKLRVADVVRATGMSKSTLHKLYNEESSRIDFNTIDQLCEFLDVQVGDLFVYKPNTEDDDEA